MRGCVWVLLAVVIGCRPAPVLNPDKERATESASTVQREVEMASAPGGVVIPPGSARGASEARTH